MSLSQLISWSNLNSGFLLVVLTTIYSIATIAMFVVMKRANGIAGDNLAHAQKLVVSTSRPYLSISLKFVPKVGNEPSIPYAYVVVKNNGQSQALGVKALVSPKLETTALIDGVRKKRSPYFFDHEIFGISPREELSDAIGFTPELFEAHTLPVFRGSVQYQDVLGNSYAEEFELNFDILREAIPGRERET